jgi:DNA polymerase-3 subunit epsilon
MRQVFLDTETTGLNPLTGDRIVEVACIEMVGRRLTERYLHHYVNPERHNSEEAVRIHGLTDDFLANKPIFSEVASELAEFLADAELIIHNAAFDVGFLNEEFRRCGLGTVGSMARSVTDSLMMAREMFPGKANSLDALCKRLEVDNSHRSFHGALLDAQLLAEVYVRMTRGQETLAIDTDGESPTGPSETGSIKTGFFHLPILKASPQEIERHESVLTELDKASGGKTLWRQMPDSVA